MMTSECEWTILDWSALIGKGLEQIAPEARAATERVGDEASLTFAANVERCCRAVASYVGRYAAAAERGALLAAQAHPERCRSLCVRVAGFSEYFCALSGAQQEMIERPEFCG